MAAATDYSEDELLEYLTHLSKSRRSVVRSRQIDVALDGLLALGWGKESANAEC